MCLPSTGSIFQSSTPLVVRLAAPAELEELVHVVIVVAYLRHLLLRNLVLLDERLVGRLRDTVVEVSRFVSTHLAPVCVNVFVGNRRWAITFLERNTRVLRRLVSIEVGAWDPLGLG